MAEGLGSLTFRELHLLPRVVFAIGAVFFVGGLFHSNPFMASFGLGLVFLAVAYNLLFDFFLNLSTRAPEKNPKRFNMERESLILHSMMCLILAIYCFYALYAVLVQGTVPFLFRLWG